MNSANNYVNDLINSLTKITMTEFFKEVHSKFYNNIDITFMDYFLELTEHENGFYIQHDKLIEYGIMTSKRSNHIKEKLDALGMQENENYIITNIQEQINNSGTKHKKIYILTPESFKKCLMRAQRRADQPVDPTIYCDYYILLEKIYNLYTKYEREYSNKLLSVKDDKIDILKEQNQKMIDICERFSLKLDLQSETITHIKDQNKNLKETVEDISDQNKNLKETVDTVNFKLDDVTEQNHELKETVTTIANHLVDKSFASTKNPINTNKHHYFAVSVKDNVNGNYVKLTSGQKKYVENRLVKLSNDGYKIGINPFYNANGIDLRNNIVDELNKYINSIFKPINEQRQKTIDDLNEVLKTDIHKCHSDKIVKPISVLYNIINKLHLGNINNLISNQATLISIKKLLAAKKTSFKKYISTFTQILEFSNSKLKTVINNIDKLITDIDNINDNKQELTDFTTKLSKIKAYLSKYTGTFRSYKNEMKYADLLTLDSIGLVISSTSIKYTMNDYISYDSILQIIYNVNKETQTSPYTTTDDESNNEDEESKSDYEKSKNKEEFIIDYDDEGF